MVYSTRRSVVCLSVCHFVLVFVSPFSIAITSLGEERANLSAFRTFCSVYACLDLSVFSSSWGLGRAAVCDCGTPWTFLLLFWGCFGVVWGGLGSFYGPLKCTVKLCMESFQFADCIYFVCVESFQFAECIFFCQRSKLPQRIPLGGEHMLLLCFYSV